MSNIGKVRKNYVYLNGEDAYIELPDSFVQDTDEISVYIEYEWEEPNGTIAYFFGNGGSDRSFVISMYSRGLSSIGGVMQVGFDDSSGAWRSHNWYGVVNYARNSRWVFAQNKKGSLRVFVEGANIEWTDLNYDMLRGVPFKYIGYYTSGRLFKGRIYKVLVWFRYFGDNEIEGVKNGVYPSDGLKLWLDGDSIDEVNGVWRDKSGNGNDGQFVGNVEVVKDVSVANRSGLVFNNINDSVIVDGSKFGKLEAPFTIISVFKYDYDKVNNLWTKFVSGYSTAYQSYAYISHNKIWVSMYDNNGEVVCSQSEGNFSQDNLYMVVKVVNYNNCYVYLNCSRIINEQYSGIIGNGNTDVRIGNQNNNTWTLYGKEFMFVIFNEAKNDDWIKQFYEDWQNGKDMSKYWQDESCVLWLDGDSIGEDGIWYDKSGKDNNGQIYGARKVESVGGG